MPADKRQHILSHETLHGKERTHLQSLFQRSGGTTSVGFTLLGLLSIFQVSSNAASVTVQVQSDASMETNTN